MCLVTDTDSPGYGIGNEKPSVKTPPSPGLAPAQPQPQGLTRQDGLVHSQSGGLDLDEAEVSGHFVSHCGERLG